MWSKDCIINPLKWKQTITQVAVSKEYYLFAGEEQNDLPEFLLFMIDTFNEALSRPVEIEISGEEINDVDKFMNEFERPLILKSLEFCKGNQIKTSQILGINRNTLRSKLKKLKISSKYGK